MRILLLLLFSLNCQAGWIENEPTFTEEQRIYLEEMTFRLNNIHLLEKISQELKAIRCQNEVSEYCENTGEENEL